MVWLREILQDLADYRPRHAGDAGPLVIVGGLALVVVWSVVEWLVG